MITEVPQWVSQAFVRSARAAGATADAAALESACNELISAWGEPPRAFHNLRHLFEVLNRVDSLASEAQHPDYVRLAAWGHGVIFSTSDQAVYSRQGGEDEAASAAYMSAFYRRIGIPEDVITTITGLITGLRRRHDYGGKRPHDGDPGQTASFEAIDMDRLTLCDAHLGTLAADPQRYKKYLQGVREEYTHISERDFLNARKAIVTALLDRKKIYVTPLATQWEQVARQNLTAELDRIEAKIATCSTEEPVEAPRVEPEPEPVVDLEQIAAEDAQNYALREVSAVSSRSTLEEFDDAFEPGAPPRVRNPEEERASRRAEISERARKSIEERHQEAALRRQEEDAPRNSMETAPDF